MGKKPKKARHRYRVWFEQVNQTYIDVLLPARDPVRAGQLAERQWRRAYGSPELSSMTYVGEE